MLSNEVATYGRSRKCTRLMLCGHPVTIILVLQYLIGPIGPIVRINPYELHVADPTFVDTLYPTGAKNVEKWSWSAGMFGSTEMTFGTVGHALHRRRRGAFSHFFSKASVRRLEPFLQTLVDQLCQKLSQYTDTGVPVNMVHAYSALTQDVITEYCFSNCRNVLEMENFSPWYYDLVQKPCELCQMSVPSVTIFFKPCYN